jgi:hypothetical protein
MIITSTSDDIFEVQIEAWQMTGDDYKKWTATCQNRSAETEYLVFDLTPNSSYRLSINGQQTDSQRTDSRGCLKFKYNKGYAVPQTFEIRQK